MKKLGILLLCGVFVMFGCKTTNYGPLEDGLPTDYKSQLYVEMWGTGEVDFEYLGFGEGSSVGTDTKSFDRLEAYKAAIGGDGNVILVNANSQIVKEKTEWPGPLGIFLDSTKNTFKVWGHKVRVKGVKPTPGKKPILQAGDRKAPGGTEAAKGKHGGIFGFLGID